MLYLREWVEARYSLMKYNEGLTYPSQVGQLQVPLLAWVTYTLQLVILSYNTGWQSNYPDRSHAAKQLFCQSQVCQQTINILVGDQSPEERDRAFYMMGSKWKAWNLYLCYHLHLL